MRISDWISDVCSSALLPVAQGNDRSHRHIGAAADILLFDRRDEIAAPGARRVFEAAVDERLGEIFEIQPTRVGERVERSEERRVGKEGVSTGRSRWSPDQ